MKVREGKKSNTYVHDTSEKIELVLILDKRQKRLPLRTRVIVIFAEIASLILIFIKPEFVKPIPFWLLKKDSAVKEVMGVWTCWISEVNHDTKAVS
ncbi:hypothetical protein BT69DRAFT_1339098 [Atractiella rhizophila]|nr:hypothetical protein BT69DRAFT_1339098 [Atractiella rhizophila]